MYDTKHDSIASLHFIHGQLLFEYRENKEMVRKCLSPDAVRRALTLQHCDSGWIAPRTIRHGEGPQGPWVIQHYPAATYTLNFDTPITTDAVSQLTVPLPALLFLGTHHGYGLFAIRAWRQDATVLYHAPLPNISPDGQICYGTATPPPISPLAISEAWQLFWRTTFNNDHTRDKSHRHPDSILDQLVHVTHQRLRDYPGDDLVRAPRTLANLLHALTTTEH